MSGLVQDGGRGEKWGRGLGNNMPLQKSHAAISVISYYWIWLNGCLNAGLVWVGGETVVMERIAGCLHRKVSGRFKLTNFGGTLLPHLGPTFFILMQLPGKFWAGIGCLWRKAVCLFELLLNRSEWIDGVEGGGVGTAVVAGATDRGEGEGGQNGS